MKKILYVFIGFLVATVWACNQADPSDVAAHAAKQYYDYLLEDKYEAFVDGQYRPDSIPASYREQLIVNAKMFVGQQKEEIAPARKSMFPWWNMRVSGICADT